MSTLLPVFGIALVALSLIFNIPTVNLICLIAAAILLIVSELVPNHQSFSKFLLFFAMFSLMVLPFFNFWEQVNLSHDHSDAALVVLGLCLVVIGFRDRLFVRKVL